MVRHRRLCAFLLIAPWLACPLLRAQNPCANTPAYTPCEFVFELSAQDAAAHPNPYLTVRLHAEFRSPRFRTFLMPAFWDGGRRMVIRFTPTEAGEWTYRVTSNLAAFEGQSGTFTAAPSEAPGFIRTANVHHWAYTENNRPHLWMGDTCLGLATLDETVFRRLVDARSEQKFNHIRGLIVSEETAALAFPGPDRVNPEYFHGLDGRIRYINSKGMVADLMLAPSADFLARRFPDWQQRERFVRYVVARYAPLNITWMGVGEFESYQQGRSLLKEVGGLLRQADPYDHPSTTSAALTSAPLLADRWMNFVAYQTGDDQVGAVEHQLYGAPFVNLRFAREDSGAGKSTPDDMDADAFRHRLWNATMDGQYPTFANTGTYGGGKVPVDAKYLDSPGARQMGVWYEFFSGTRHWELEPYFDVDGGRALALEGVEYIVYVEKARPLELLVEKHSYDVAWINPSSGERIKQKEFKGERFTGQAPDPSHDWVLHVSREGRKEGMLRSYKFESREIAMQEIEHSPAKVPFVVEQPSAGPLAVGHPAPCGAKITRETRATRAMMWLWTGDVAADSQGYRVLATGAQGRIEVPPNLSANYPASLLLRLYGMNANGKVYGLDRVYELTK